MDPDGPSSQAKSLISAQSTSEIRNTPRSCITSTLHFRVIGPTTKGSMHCLRCVWRPRRLLLCSRRADGRGAEMRKGALKSYAWLAAILLLLGVNVPGVAGSGADEWQSGVTGSGGSGTSVKGYVCTKGVFSPKDTLEEFAAAFKERESLLGRHNTGGLRLMNSYAIWQVVLAVQPPLIIESGVHQGWTSWLLRHASDKYGGATIVRMDPGDGGPKAWQDRHPDSVNMRGRNFADFNRVKWAERYSADVLSRALVFFDDHQDQVQ